MLLSFNIIKQLIYRTDCEIPVAKSENYLRAQFSFSEEWQGIKTAIFNNGTAYSVILDEKNTCLVPWEVITEGGFSVSVFCGQRITANTVFVDVLPSGYVEGETPQPPSPDVYEQLMGEIQKKVETIVAGDNVTVQRIGNTVTISAKGGGMVDAYTKAETNALLDRKQDKGNYATSTELQEEETARQNADTNLQGQIDAITVSSDVIDVLGTYQDLLDYDTQHVKANDIIKVMQDSTHSDAISYYRWVIANDVGSWVYVGSEGPYYTKAEADGLLQAKLNIAQGSTNANKLVATDNDGNVNSFTDIQTLTGRQPLDLKDNSTGHAGTSSDPVRLEDITAGFYDIINGGYICANPSGSYPNARKRQLPTGSFFYTDGTYSFFVDDEGETYLVDNAGSVYSSWGDGIHIDRKTLVSYCSAFLVSSVAEETYLSKTDASNGYQPKNRYVTNTAVPLNDWNEEVTPTYADYPYKATITITGVTANDYAHIVFAETDIDKLYPNCNTVSNGIEIFASEPVAITIPTIKIEG